MNKPDMQITRQLDPEQEKKGYSYKHELLEHIHVFFFFLKYGLFTNFKKSQSEIKIIYYSQKDAHIDIISQRSHSTHLCIVAPDFLFQCEVCLHCLDTICQCLKQLISLQLLWCKHLH